MDPAALGNTLIGLEAVRREQSLDEPASMRRHRSPERRPSRLRTGLATALRAAADAIDTRPRERALGI